MSDDDKNQTTAAEEGKMAAMQGRQLSDNPYPAGSTEHALWVLGHDSVAHPTEEV